MRAPNGPVTLGTDIGVIKMILTHAAAVRGRDISLEPVDLARVALTRRRLTGTMAFPKAAGHDWEDCLIHGHRRALIIIWARAHRDMDIRARMLRASARLIHDDRHVHFRVRSFALGSRGNSQRVEKEGGVAIATEFARTLWSMLTACSWGQRAAPSSHQVALVRAVKGLDHARPASAGEPRAVGYAASAGA